MIDMDKKPVIYLVDDDSSALRGMTRLLLAAGYEVHAYKSSDEFIKSPLTDKNTCLILDAQMPGLSGVELQIELTTRGLDLPVIFVTADDNKETRMKARMVKASGFFGKPVDGPALLDAIAWALETHGKDDDVSKSTEKGESK